MGEPGEVEPVVPGVVLQAGGLHTAEALLDVAGGVLDGQDTGVLGQAGQGAVLNTHAGAAGDVVDHDRQVGGLDHGHNVPVDALLAGAVVVRGVNEQGLGPGRLGAHANAHGVGGVVAPGPGHEQGASFQGVLDLTDEGLLLRQVGGGGLAGGSRQEDEVGAVVHQGDGELLGGTDVDDALWGKGRDHGHADGAEGTGGRCGRSRHGQSLRLRRPQPPVTPLAGVGPCTRRPTGGS